MCELNLITKYAILPIWKNGRFDVDNLQSPQYSIEKLNQMRIIDNNCGEFYSQS